MFKTISIVFILYFLVACGGGAVDVNNHTGTKTIPNTDKPIEKPKDPKCLPGSPCDRTIVSVPKKSASSCLPGVECVEKSSDTNINSTTENNASSTKYCLPGAYC